MPRPKLSEETVEQLNELSRPLIPDLVENPTTDMRVRAVVNQLEALQDERADG